MTKLTPAIGLRSAIILVVSVIVGSGVFKKIAPMAATVHSPALVILCWVLAGLVSLAGALSNAEMAGMFPDSGGEYVYYQKVYGRFFAFLYGWSNFLVTKTATIAALAYVFAQSLSGLLPIPEVSSDFSGAGWSLLANYPVKVAASFLIIGLSYVNYRGVLFAEKISRFLTYLMFVAVITMIVVGLTAPQGSLANVTQSSQYSPDLHGLALLTALLTACLGAFWGYEGWNNISFIGEEVKNPQRNLPLALSIGTLIVIVLYVLLNVTYVYILPVDAFIQWNTQPNAIAAVEVFRYLKGPVGAALVAGLILVTTVNSTNSSVLMSARIFYAMSRDGLFFRQAATVHPQYKTPSVAIGLQAFWSVLLVWSGSFDQLTDMLVFASFIFYGATALGVILLRIKQPDLPRSYRVPGYPVIPMVFCLFCLGLVVSTLFTQPAEASVGLALMLTGIPFYFYWKRN
jgi:APA family basic amino acid/polyamine antiporter